MNITYLKRNKIDTKKWDKCIESNLETATLSAMSWYLDVCCGEWSALIIDDYRSVIPLPLRKKFTIEYIYVPFFTSILGVFGEKITASDLDKVLCFASKYFKWIELTFSPNTEINISQYQHFTHRTYEINLQQPYNIIQQTYHKQHLYHCKRADRSQLKITENADIDTIISLFINNKGKNRHVGYRTKDYRRLKNLIRLLQTKNAVEILGVEDDAGKLCAGAFFTHKFGKYIFLFSGREHTKVQNRSMYFLLDNFIRTHAQTAVYLQTNGSNNDKLAKFYAGFGGKELYCPQITIESLNNFSKTLLSIYRKLR